MNTTIDRLAEWTPEVAQTITLPDAPPERECRMSDGPRARQSSRGGIHRGALACLAAAVLFGAFAGRAGAQEGKTPINSFPFTITQSGSYYLTASVSSPPALGTMIFINADGVTLDLNGHSLIRNSGGTNDLTVAIYSDNRRSIVVKNGQIQNFGVGVLLNSSSAIARNNVVQHMNIRGCTSSGIIVLGDGCVIEHNKVADIGGYVIASRYDTYGILYSGDCGRVVDNDVSNVRTATAFAGLQYANGIYSVGADCVIDRNRITRDNSTIGAGTIVAGINIADSTAAMITSNTISLSPTGTTIGMRSDDISNRAFVRDNVLAVGVFPYVGFDGEGSGAPAASNSPTFPP